MAQDTVYAGIDIGGTNIKYGLVDAKGKVLFKEQRPTMAEKGPGPLMHLIANIAERLLYHAADEDLEVKWLGVGTPGAVDFRTGRLIGLSPNINGWHGIEIGQNLRERINMPVFVDNDVNAMALAEARFGAAVGYGFVVCVAVGTGIGGGIVIDGKLWRGSSYTAGHIGHMSINVNGPLCKCGVKGCLEAYCSSGAMLSLVKTKLNSALTPIFEDVLDGSLDNLSIKRLFAAAKKEDEVALSVINETAQFLGLGLAGVVNLLNPDIVVIGGGVADGGAGYVETVAAEIRRHSFNEATENLRIARASLGNDAGFIGAGILGESRS